MSSFQIPLSHCNVSFTGCLDPLQMSKTGKNLTFVCIN